MRSLVVLAALLVAQATSASAEAPRALETFRVGDNVYARSLLAEAGTLWVGTSAGVMEIDLASRNLRNTFTREQGLANEYVFAIGLDRNGYKWFGTNAGGATRYRDGEWKTFFPMHGLADYWIYAFAQQRSGPFWIGTWAGASRLDLDTLRFTNYAKELVNVWVYGIDVDSKDRVWFGTEGGMSMFDGKEWRHWTHADGLGAPNTSQLPASSNTGLGTRARHDLSVMVEGRESYNPNYVFAVHVAPDDTVWAGTWGGGVARFDGATWRNYTVADGLAGNIVYSIAQDRAGVLWFGTNHGLSRFDAGEWRNYGVADGLPEDDVYAIATLADGDVWAGFKGAVVRLGHHDQPPAR
ncbi:MAG: two-component regulator propeller domain-containing protein [Gammaproteobacteria bacterium]